MTNDLAGRRILLVEDDYYEASELASRLVALGVVVAGPVPDVARALEQVRADEGLAGAILDINLGGEMVFPVADELERRALPFIFATGYDRDVVPVRHADKILLRKPLDDDAVVAALLRVTSSQPAMRADANQNALLSRLSPAELDVLVPRFQKVYLPRGAILEVHGQPVSRVYFPLSCLASVVVVGRDGGRIEAGIVGREGMTGFSLAQGDDQAPFEMINQIEGIALTLSVGDLRQAITVIPNLRLLASRFSRVMGVQASYTAFTNGRFEIPQRLARWLLMIQDRLHYLDDYRLTHDYLAIMLGVRRPSVTDALHLLEGEGLIRSMRGQIIVLDRRRLVEFAGEAYGAPEEEYARLMSLPLVDHPVEAETSRATSSMNG
jgi:CRP-like cAMP-binding protein